MKKMPRLILLITLLVCWFAGNAQANVYTFTSNDSNGANSSDMMDLDHNYYYGWSIMNSTANDLAKNLADGYEIVSAKLVYKNIWNWQYETTDKLYTYLLQNALPIPGAVTQPVYINGVAQGSYAYTWTRTVMSERKLTDPSYIYQDTKVVNGRTRYIYTKTVTSINSPGSGYVKTSSPAVFVPKTETLKAGVVLSDNLWERYDGQSTNDVNWGEQGTFTLIWDDTSKTSPTPNPWHDEVGGEAGEERNFDLTYDFDQALINLLYVSALDGNFGFGIDPDCHYYNEGITFIVVTEPIGGGNPPVPEPGILFLLGFGIIGIGILRKKIS